MDGTAAGTPRRMEVGIPGVGMTSSYSLTTTPTGRTRCSSSCSMAERLSVRSDWSSEMHSEGSLLDATGMAEDGSPLKQNKASHAVLSAGLEEAFPVSETGEQPRQVDAVSRTVSRIIDGEKPICYGVHCIQNQRPEMEDAHRAVIGNEACGGSTSSSQRSLGSGAATSGARAEAPLSPMSYFAVFDGHGGSLAAEFAADRLYSILTENTDLLRKDAKEALQIAFRRTEEEWLLTALEKEWMDGSTAAVALVDRGRGCVTVGNVGDSEVLLGMRDAAGKERFVVLSEVHHVKRNEAERNRILDLGGRVWKGRLGHPAFSPAVVSLSVSRALGDLFYKHSKYTNGQATGLDAAPFITSAEVCNPESKDEFLLIGCDGFFDTVSYKEATEFVFSHVRGPGTNMQEVSEACVRLAQSKGSSDNITVLVALL